MSNSDKVTQTFNRRIEKELQSGRTLYVTDVNKIMNEVISENINLFSSNPDKIIHGCNIYSFPQMNQLIIDPQTGIVKGIKKSS